MSELVTSPFFDLYTPADIPLSEYHGALVPQRFSDPRDEHRAVRTEAGFFDLSFRLKTLARGADRGSFLHNMLSNDIERLKPGEGTYATFLNLKGHMVADLRVYSAGEMFLLDTDADLRQKLIETLGRYILMDDVTLEPADLCALAFEGPRSRQLLAAATGSIWPPLEEFQHAVVSYQGSALRMVRVNGTGEEGYEVWGEPLPLRALWQAASRRAAEFGALPCGTEALESLRIEAGLPRFGQDMGADTIPLEAGLLNAISFTKGCYLGQEVIERLRSRGHVNWKLAGVWIDSPAAPAPPQKLADAGGREVGEITSSCVSPTLARTIALAFVRREASEPGTRLRLASGPAAEVAQLPFYRRQG